MRVLFQINHKNCQRTINLYSTTIVERIFCAITSHYLSSQFTIKTMDYENYYFWGMHLLWWVIWVIVAFWIFATPYTIPGQRTKKDSPLDILNKRLASGQITNEEYQEKKKLIKST